MIKYTDKDIFELNANMLICPVNCVGVMGKGLALQFKKAYPSYFNLYKQDCKDKRLTPGLTIPQYMDMSNPNEPFIIVSFCTKDHWRDPSKIEWIVRGTVMLRSKLSEMRRRELITNKFSVAIPPIGCGLGGLNKTEVKEVLETFLKDVDVTIYLTKF